MDAAGRGSYAAPDAACYREDDADREASPREASESDRREADGARQAQAQAADQRQNSPASPPGAGAAFDARDWLTQATGEMRDSFARNRRVMSFAEYVALFGAEPARQLRSAAQYLRDVFDHFGTEHGAHAARRR